ncbi:MAG: YdcF family protein [Verrucomicrobiia bacterium]
MLSQLIHSLIYIAEPIGFIWFLILVGAVIFAKRKNWLASLYCLIIAGVISLIGGTPVPGKLMELLEKQYIKQNPYDLPVCDAVVSLGGSVQGSRYDAHNLDLMFTADRIFMAVELIKRGRAKNLLVGGSGYEVDGVVKIEPDMVKKWLVEWRLVDVPIYSLGATENTYEEALRVAALAKTNEWKQIILVTSAYHLPRAAATFKKATGDIPGFVINCVPCDFQTSLSIETPTAYTLVPRYQGFVKLSLFIREIIGTAMYKLRGWA